MYFKAKYFNYLQIVKPLLHKHSTVNYQVNNDESRKNSRGASSWSHGVVTTTSGETENVLVASLLSLILASFTDHIYDSPLQLRSTTA